MTEPWPSVRVDGHLERAEAEWLHTNGAGAYAMSTVALMHTRRYHSMFVAALSPPSGRFSVLGHAESTVRVGRRTYRLSTHQFPGIAPTPGYRLLESFSQDPIPKWTFRLGRARLEQTLCLARGDNALVIGYQWFGKRSVDLSLRPLLSLRGIHELTHEHGAMMQRARLRSGEVEIKPVDSAPAVVFRHPGVFVGSPDWYRRFEYLEDQVRGVEFQEDLWTPGTFEISLEPQQTTYVVVAVDALPTASAEQIVEETVSVLSAVDPGPERPLAVRQLVIAGEQFCLDACEHPVVIAGYPWLEAQSRDLLIALPGLYLVRGRLDAAKRVLASVLEALDDGLLPRRLRTANGGGAVSADASLWLMETARLLVAQTGTDDRFLRDELYPALISVFRRVTDQRREVLWLVEDGLVANGADDAALTWMDARSDDVPTTPRRGLAIELQALWSKGCETLAALSHCFGDTELAHDAERRMAATREAFRKRFWCERTRYPYDCIGEECAVDHAADATIRPNALIALDVDPALFEPWQATSIVEQVRRRLLTARGIRSLDPEDPEYRGQYGGPAAARRATYHQGLAWTHLLGAYARAALRASSGDFEVQEDLRDRIDRAREGGIVLGQIPQFSDGEPPYRPGGCPAQAWAVAELFRTLEWELNV